MLIIVYEIIQFPIKSKLSASKSLFLSRDSCTYLNLVNVALGEVIGVLVFEQVINQAPLDPAVQ